MAGSRLSRRGCNSISAPKWDLPFVPGLTLTGRAIYTGAQYIDTTYPRRMLPDWTRFDLGARYAFDNLRSPTAKPITIRFNVDNVLDTTYWAGGFGATTLSIGSAANLQAFADRRLLEPLALRRLLPREGAACFQNVQCSPEKGNRSRPRSSHRRW
jgi:hypothetical protein